MSAKKKSSPIGRGGDSANERIWIDRVAVELKAQREWAQKWQLLADPKLYATESNRTISSQAQKTKPTKWCAFSVINPPGKSPIEEVVVPPSGFAAPTYKITGSRDRFLSRVPSTTIKETSKSRHSTQSRPDLNISGHGIKSHNQHFSDLMAQRSMQHTPRQEETRASKTKKQNLQHATFGAAHYHYESASNGHRNNDIQPSHYNAPFATNTPVSEEAISTLAKHHRASLRMYSTNLVGARSGTRSQFAEDPQKIYKHPVTSSMEYGWVWSGRKTLEIYGTTSADFANGNSKTRS